MKRPLDNKCRHVTAPVLKTSRNTSVSTCVQNDIGLSTVSIESSHCPDILQLSQNGNRSLSSQPNAARPSHLLDFKANVDVSESMYSNTAIPLPVWGNRFQCVDFQHCT